MDDGHLALDQEERGKTQQPTDPLANWKERADRENYDPVRIHDHALQLLMIKLNNITPRGC